MCSNNKPIIVIGHRTLTDSICSAICYADLKSKITNETYIAKRQVILMKKLNMY